MIAAVPSTLDAALLHDGRRKRSRSCPMYALDAACILYALVCALVAGALIDLRHASVFSRLNQEADEAPMDKTFYFVIDFIAGGVAGAIAKTIAAPLERVKLLIQTQDANPLIISGEVPRYTSMLTGFRRVYDEQGFMAFWRGNLPNVLRYFPIAAFNFAFKDTIEGLFPAYDPQTEFIPFCLVNLFSGGVAGALSLSLVFPLDYSRTRLAADVGSTQRTFAGLGDCLMKTVRANGPWALYKGYGISVVGIFFYRAPYIGLFDTLEGINPYRYKLGAPWQAYVEAVSSAFLLAQVVAVIAAAISYPFDTVRRRLQMESEKFPKDRIYRGAYHCFWRRLENEGVLGLYKGFVANLWRGAATAAVLVVYRELTRHVLPHRTGEV